MLSAQPPDPAQRRPRFVIVALLCAAVAAALLVASPQSSAQTGRFPGFDYIVSKVCAGKGNCANADFTSFLFNDSNISELISDVLTTRAAIDDFPSVSKSEAASISKEILDDPAVQSAIRQQDSDGLANAMESAAKSLTGTSLSADQLGQLGTDLSRAARPFEASPNFSKWDISGANFSHFTLSKPNLRNAKVTGANFESATLDRIDFSGLDLTGTSFKDAIFESPTFSTTLRSAPTLQSGSGKAADFTGATFKGDTDLTKLVNRDGFNCANCTIGNDSGTIKLGGAKFAEGSDLTGSKWHTLPSGTLDLTKTNFNGATLDNAEFGGSAEWKLSGTDFSNVSAQNAKFTNVTFDTTLFKSTDFTNADMIGARLDNVNAEAGVFKTLSFAKSNLRTGQWTGTLDGTASFGKIDFSEADLTEADVRWAVKGTVDFTSTDFTNAQADLTLDASSGLSKITFDGAKFNDAGIALNASSGNNSISFKNADFTSAELHNLSNDGKVDFTGATFSNVTQARGAKLKLTKEAILADVTFDGANMSGLAASDVDFSKAKSFTKADFSNAGLTGTNWNGSSLDGVKFDGANLSKAEMRGVTVDGGTTFNGTTLSGTDFTDADFTNAPKAFSGAKIASVDLSTIRRPSGGDAWDFSRAQLVDVKFTSDAAQAFDLTNADFSGTTLTRQSFEGTTLKNADFTNAEFGPGVSFANADLSAAKFGGTKFSDAASISWSGANLANADFSAMDLATFQSLNFEGAAGLDQATKPPGADSGGAKEDVAAAPADADAPTTADTNSNSAQPTVDVGEPGPLTPAQRAELGTDAVVISRGMAGDHVRRIQQMLADKGFEVGPVDGIYGPRTAGAVGEYQARYSLLNDQEVGRQVYGSLTST